MRALLDTNIIIHRENHKVSNYSIGHLFRWLDKVKIEKVIHPYSVDEIKKYNDVAIQENYKVKLESYGILKTIKNPSSEFLNLLKDYSFSDNDIIDNQLLYEVYSGRVDLFITEDRKIIKKAEKIGIENKVFSINQFITRVSAKNPSLIDYKVLSVRKEYFGNLDIDSDFFLSFKRDYLSFGTWFSKKCDETAYICEDENNNLLGFLYLKIEDENENYVDIIPTFSRKKRLKVGTFKVESTGFRLGERFMKVIFDNALLYNVDEIYVTLFKQSEELMALYDLLLRWGFAKFGIKSSSSGEEDVLVKNLGKYNKNLSCKENFPNIDIGKQKLFLPILPKFHSRLLPDSQIKNENIENLMDKSPHSYALQKVYVSLSYERNIHPGDMLLVYRMGDTSNKKYSSLVTTVGIVKNIEYNFKNKRDFLRHCQNRSVFTKEELDLLWNKESKQLLVVKFLYYKTLEKNLTLGYLWENGIIEVGKGARPFAKISDRDFSKILTDSGTVL